MENCEKVLNLINEYADGELKESDAEFVRAHLEICGTCKKAYGELLEIEKIFEESSEEAPAELCQNIMAKIKIEKSLSAKRKKFTKIFGGVAVAAVISLTVLASPAILLVATGGAKAECNDMAEMFAPSENDAGFDNYYSDMMPECDMTVEASRADGKSEIKDCSDDVATLVPFGNSLIEQGKNFTANMADGTSTAISFEKTADKKYRAILNGKNYEYRVDGNTLYLTDGNNNLVFEINRENGVCFSQTGESNG